MSNEHILLKGALLPSLIAGSLAIFVFTVVKGAPGFYGAAIAQLVVIFYFVAHLLVSKITRDVDPMSTMALALLSYFAKLIFIAGLLIVLTKFTSRSAIDRSSFGITAVLLTFTWLTAEVSYYLKLKTHLPLPPK